MISSQQVVSLLEMTMQAKTVQEAESLMLNARTSEGFTTQLLLIADNHQLSEVLRLAALVNLKTTIDQCYVAVQPGQFELAAQDKAVLRESILEALIRSCDQPRLIPLFSEVIYSLAKHDYSLHWQSLLQKIVVNLKDSSSYATIYGSLVALKALVSTFSTLMFEEKAGLFNIVAMTFPSLQQLTHKLFQSFNDKTAEVLLLVLKVFSTATYGDLPPNLKNSDSLHLWFIFFKKIMDIEGGPQTSEQLLKLKHRAAKIVYRFVQHHANPKYDWNYAERFLGRYAVSFLESFVLLLLSPLTGTWKSKMDKLAMLAFPYFYRWKPCQERLDQHRAAIIPIVLQRSKLTVKDLETWVQDPSEFIHGEKENRKEPLEVLRMYADSPHLILDGLVRVLKQPNSTDIDKEIYMFVFGELPNEIMEKVDQPILIEVLTNYIVPTMSHQSELLRARACEVFASYIDLPLSESTLEKAASSIYQCFLTGSLPIRTHAARALSDLLVKYDHLAAFIQPYLTDILTGYLKLIDSIDAEDVVYSFESLVAKLSDRIQPFAVGIVRSLQDVFYKFCEKENAMQNDCHEDEEEEEYEQNTGSGCLATIRQVLSGSLQQETYMELASDIHRLVSFILADETYSYLEEGLNILNLFVFKVAAIPGSFMEFYPILIYMIIGVPLEVLTLPSKPPHLTKIVNNIAEGRDKQILSEVIGSLRNYIAKLKRLLFTAVDIVGQTYIRRMWQTIEYSRTGPTGNPSTKKDQLAVCETLLITLIQNNMGAIDDEMQTVLSFVLGQLINNSNDARLRLINLQIVSMSFVYNAGLVLRLLDGQQLTEAVITLLLQNLSLFKADFEKQRLMLGLIKLLEATAVNTTSPAFKYAQPIVKFLAELAVDVVKMRMNDDKSESECSEAEQDNSHLFSAANQHANKEHEDEDAEIDWEDEYNKLYLSPLELEDEIVCLRSFLQGSGSRYVGLLSVQEQQMLSQAVAKADELKRNAQSAAS